MVNILENPIKMDDLGVPLFSETPICFKWVETTKQLLLRGYDSNSGTRASTIYGNFCRLLISLRFSPEVDGLSDHSFWTPISWELVEQQVVCP